MVALFKYFKPKHKAKLDVLPDPHGPLAAVISPSAIETANQCVVKELEKSHEGKSSPQDSIKCLNGECSHRCRHNHYSHVKNHVKAWSIMTLIINHWAWLARMIERSNFAKI